MSERQGDATIDCGGAVKRYRGRAAVDSVTLRIEGGICALLGANGAGKSTLLRMMTGLEKADAGKITVAGFDVSEGSTELKQCIGVLPDQLGLFESLSVMENLLCVGPIYGLSLAETKARAETLLRLLEMTAQQRTLAADCSYEMRKKTALAMALLHNPRVLFLDEPFEGVDPSSSRAIERLIVELAARGRTVVVTSHILSLVERLATRTIVLRKGSIAWDSDLELRTGTLEELYFDVVGKPLGETPLWLG